MLVAVLADLHRHLDGSLRPSTLEELARAQGLTVPPDLRFVRGMGLEAALSRFGFILSLIQGPAAVRRVAAEICEDATSDGVTTLEIRFAPQLHEDGTIEAITDAALEGMAGRAGLILCGLYGEAPELIDHLVEVARTRPGVVGIDLAGGPALDHRHGMLDYAPAFRRAEELGIGRTVHAGEGRPPAEIRTAIEELRAQRIGHGTTLLDDPRVLDLVLARGVAIEACPTSNVHTGVIRDVADHPLPRWLDLGVRACVCTDNTYLSAVTSSEEHRRTRLSAAQFERAIANGHSSRFLR
jgi:adenosine deaminase